ncbi:hypothetical protein [Brevundimonas sp.]|uniref:hypothetical protein n=1 Tax=Brevundimonas sp. TaxID=1871086 RepID=UPI003F705267
MSIRLTLAAAATLAFASPAFAQDAPAAPPAPPAAPATPAQASPEEVALTARVEAAAQPLEAMMEAIKPRAAAIRADASLSAADKETQVRALLAEHQSTLDEFSAAVQALVLYKASAEGAEPEEAAQAASMVGGMINTQIAQALLTGEAEGE